MREWKEAKCFSSRFNAGKEEGIIFLGSYIVFLSRGERLVSGGAGSGLATRCFTLRYAWKRKRGAQSALLFS